MEIFKLLDFVLEHFLRFPKLADQSFSFLFDALPVRNVACKATRVDETVLLPQNVGCDQDMLDGSVFCPEPRLVILQYLLPAQSSQNVFDHGTIDMEFSNVMADVFVGAIPQQI